MNRVQYDEAAPSANQGRLTHDSAEVRPGSGGGKAVFTTGKSVFYGPRGYGNSVSEIRHALEIKLAACLAAGGTNGCPVQPHRIKDVHLRQIIAAAMLCKEWNPKDLTECTGPLQGPATTVLLATLDRPIWGASDYHILAMVEKLESFKNAAWKGGMTL